MAARGTTRRQQVDVGEQNEHACTHTHSLLLFHATKCLSGSCIATVRANTSHEAAMDRLESPPPSRARSPLAVKKKQKSPSKLPTQTSCSRGHVKAGGGAKKDN